MKNLYDPIRKCYVEALPEEIVRQRLLCRMVEDLGFPKELLCVEKDLKTLPHLLEKECIVKKRRADIICFAKNIHPSFPLFPLLMIECKAHAITKNALEQVLGYNHYVKAYFVAIANQKQIKTLWYNEKKKDFESVLFLPSYQQLLKAIDTDNR